MGGEIRDGLLVFSSAGSVRIKILDTTGRQVKTSTNKKPLTFVRGS